MATTQPAAATAAATLAGGSSVMLAKGSAETARTIPTIDPRAAHAGKPNATATGPGPLSIAAPPATSARPPAAIAGATRGTTSRFTMGASRANRPNQARAMGSVAASAAMDTASDSHSQRGNRPFCQPARRSVSGVAHAISPPVAAADRAKPGSTT